MNAMSQKANITLEKYRAAESLGESTRARLFEALERRIATGDWPAEGVDVSPPQPVDPGGFVAQVVGGPIGKIGLGLLVAAIPAAWLLAQREPREEVAAPAVAKESQERPSSTGALTAASEGEGRRPVQSAGESARKAPAADSEIVAPTPTAHSEAPQGRPTRPARAVNPSPARPEAANAPEETQPTDSASVAEAAPKLDTIDEEVSLLGSAHASLRAGRPSEALAKLAEHKRRFPTSKLAESREVARIIALCQAGQRETARAAAERFLATRSGSPLANRVRTVCADAGEK